MCVLLPALFLAALSPILCQGAPSIARQTGLSPFWTFLVHSSAQVAPPQASSNQTFDNDSVEDYYDLVRVREERKPVVDSRTESQTAQVLMRALHANTDPVGQLLPADKPSGTAAPRNQKKEYFVVDGDTYDDERAEMGRADEEDSVHNEDASTERGEKTDEEEEQPTIILLDGSTVGGDEQPPKSRANGKAKKGSSAARDNSSMEELPVVDRATERKIEGRSRQKLAPTDFTKPPKAKIVFGNA